MLLVLSSLALAQSVQTVQPPSAGKAKLGIGVQADLGFVPSGLTIGWAGTLFVGVEGGVGFSCYGGRAIVVTPSDAAVFGYEGTYCRDLSWQVNAESGSTGLFVGARRKLAPGRYAGFQLGLGYSAGTIEDLDATWDGFYIRPRGSASIEQGPVALDVGPFIQLPILFTQRVEGEGIGPGMLTRIGLEFSIYVGRFGS